MINKHNFNQHWNFRLNLKELALSPEITDSLYCYNSHIGVGRKLFGKRSGRGEKERNK